MIVSGLLQSMRKIASSILVPWRVMAFTTAEDALTSFALFAALDFTKLVVLLCFSFGCFCGSGSGVCLLTLLGLRYSCLRCCCCCYNDHSYYYYCYNDYCCSFCCLHFSSFSSASRFEMVNSSFSILSRHSIDWSSCQHGVAYNLSSTHFILLLLVIFPSHNFTFVVLDTHYANAVLYED